MHSAQECPYSLGVNLTGLKCAPGLNTVLSLSGDI